MKNLKKLPYVLQNLYEKAQKATYFLQNLNEKSEEAMFKLFVSVYDGNFLTNFQGIRNVRLKIVEKHGLKRNINTKICRKKILYGGGNKNILLKKPLTATESESNRIRQ